MNAIQSTHRHHHHHRRHARTELFPRWLLKLMGLSLMLGTVFMIRACALEDERIDRAASMYSGVCKWARAAGVGDVMFGTVTDRQIAGNTYLVEGSVYRSLRDPAARPDIYHWICTRDGNVVRAFGQSEWAGAKTLAPGQTADPGR